MSPATQQHLYLQLGSQLIWHTGTMEVGFHILQTLQFNVANWLNSQSVYYDVTDIYIE